MKKLRYIVAKLVFKIKVVYQTRKKGISVKKRMKKKKNTVFPHTGLATRINDITDLTGELHPEP